MSDLALACYAVLRLLVPCTGDPRISYAELVRRLPSRFWYLDLDNPQHRNELWAALGEIVEACHAHSPRLPALPAIVVKEEDGRLTYPGSGYYPVAHPGVEDEEELLVLWSQELEAVRQTQYPTQV
jgi:hypothetical protein